MLEMLRRWWRGLFGKPEPEPEPEKPTRKLSLLEIQRRVEQGRRRAGRGTSQHTDDLGMRKLTRHRAGRQHEKRMGVDHGLTMRDIEEERKPKRGRRR